MSTGLSSLEGGLTQQCCPYGTLPTSGEAVPQESESHH
ncbi:hypothetical protein Pla163_23980 [Planctomycetes bacterium Pla163]|uniref:Uncharacterized protein n=1 Tax=Rohdeia mirabilis TaxID=2528008 RepID=A0A518D1D5_9BACT|nr:hypothetical protein Pla163_23980 [Planctomycetes bacterium Pla163]